MPRLRILILALAASCSPGSGTDRVSPPAAERLYQHEVLPLAFLIPSGWTVSTVPAQTGTALVFAGPASSRDAYLPITLQLTAIGEQTLEELVEAVLSDASVQPRFSRGLPAPLTAASRHGVSYGLELELHESLQWQQAAILPAGNFWLHLSLAAVPERFPDGIPIFERVLSTLVIGTGSPGPAADLW